MRVLRLHTSGLHGYMSFDIAFNPELTFLTGINGSGKTSAVKALVALLTPSLRELARLEYSNIGVEIEVNGVVFSIAAQKADGEFALSVTGAEIPLRIPTLVRESFEPVNRFSEREHDYYREQETLNGKHPVLEQLARIPTPMFLDLERRAQEGLRRRLGVAFSPSKVSSALRGYVAGSIQESLADAQLLAEDQYRRLQVRQKDLADQLKQDLILTAFSDSLDIAQLKRPSSADLRKLDRSEQVVRSSLHSIGLSEEELEKSVGEFFRRVRAAMQAILKTDKRASRIEDETVWFMLQPQVMQVQAVVGLVENYNRRVEALLGPIQNYLSLVNRFLADSGKTIGFSPTGELEVVIDGSSPRSIGALSSGERQVIVILTHLSFNTAARLANVLIIDEPELSLHLHWQYLFVGALKGASTDVQLILATHSPAIILENVDACVDMVEARRR